MKKKLVMFGAGNIGRSFVGQVFARSGYKVVFVDIDTRVVNELNRKGHYQVVIKRNNREDKEITVSGVRAVNAKDTDAVIEELQDTPFAATSVGANVSFPALPSKAPTAYGYIPIVHKNISCGLNSARLWGFSSAVL
jgi:mannitol-1-phosphate 5-dehydrogenase